MYCLTFTYISYKLIVNNYSAINVYTAAAHAAHAAAGSSGVSITYGPRFHRFVFLWLVVL